jgi:hypothetical protein
MHPKPGGECDRTLDLMPMLSDLRDRGVAADHRHWDGHRPIGTPSSVLMSTLP